MVESLDASSGPDERTVPPSETRLREALRSKQRPIPFVGSGLSLAATGNNVAGWHGLLLNGIRTCEAADPELADRPWGEPLIQKLEQGDLHDYLAVGGEVSDRLHELNGGDDFVSWVDDTVGRLKPNDYGRKLVGEVCKLNSCIVTTNYDDLIEQVMPDWESYDWSQQEFATALNGSDVVLHLHGSVKNPASIILGGKDYESRANEFGDALTQALFATRPLIFIGCGSGLKDPHFNPVMKFLARNQDKTNVKHFILLTRKENRAFTGNPLSSKISAVTYGDDFESLLPFLQGLNADDETRVTETPQAGMPDIPSRAGVGFLFYAARAEEELSRARDALQPVAEALRNVDDARAIPPGMDGRDLAEQEDKHRQLAAGLTRPAARLDDCSQQVLPRFRTAAEPAWQAVRLNLSDRPDRLTKIRELAVGLETETSKLLSRIAEGVEDLERRITEYDPSYQDAGDRLSHAYTAFKRACVEITNLRTALDRYTMPAAGSPYAASPSDPAPRPASSASPRPDPAARADDGSSGRSLLRVAPILGEIRGGLPSGTGVPRPEEIPVPPGYSDQVEIFALLVNGYSMEKDGIVEGDYVTVLRTEDCQDGDLVAAVFGGESDEAAVVKWLRRPEGGRAYLESSEPDDTARLKEHGDFRVAGKVIGVVRWQITRLSVPPPAVDDEHTD